MGPALDARDITGPHLARRSRTTSLGAAAIVLIASLATIWIAEATADTSASASTATRISDDCAAAASAVADEERAELSYRLHPGPALQTHFFAAAARVVQALNHARQGENEPDGSRVIEQTLADHATYLTTTVQVFAATDRGDTATADRLDPIDGGPDYDKMHREVTNLADRHHAAALADLQHLQHLSSWLIPLLLTLGLSLGSVMALTGRSYRRMLAAGRASAVHESLHDQLTGLPNRTLFADRVEQALRNDQRTGNHTGLLLLDLDRFKDINDALGHQCGNQVLAQIGPRLRVSLRGSDTIARLDGDEFAIALPDSTDLPSAVAVAEKMRDALREPFAVANIEVNVDASIGVVISGENGTDATTLLRNADIAMYTAKAQHLGVCTYDGDADGRTSAKLALLGELRRALTNDEIVLHYQPKISLSTGDLVATETLLRWQHPTRGLIYPAEFITIAEHTSLIGPLTRRILEVALTQARAWSEAHEPLPVSVNLSAHNLLDPQLPIQLAALLLSHSVPPSLLVLEVTESAIMTDPDRAARMLNTLRELGIRISIDDFGAGYTSLGQLKTLPVSELKIDRSFITHITDDADDAHIVRSIIDLGHNLGLTIVAEGVETIQHVKFLTDLGCDVAQGFYYSKPLEAAGFDQWRHARSAAASDPVRRAHASLETETEQTVRSLGAHAAHGSATGSRSLSSARRQQTGGRPSPVTPLDPNPDKAP